MKSGQYEKKTAEKRYWMKLKEKGQPETNGKDDDKPEVNEQDPEHVIPEIEKRFFYQKTDHTRNKLYQLHRF